MSEPQVPPHAKSIKGISLSSFLQLLEHERKTCTLVVTQAEQSGKLFFQDGNLIQASCNNLQGIDAAYCILSWGDATFYIAKAQVHEPAINLPLAHILLTASTRHDEQKATFQKGKSVTGTPGATDPKKSALASISTKLLSIAGVQDYYLLNRQGKLVAQSGHNQQIADFIAYTVVSGIQMREALGSKGLHNIRIRLDDASTLFIVPASGATMPLT